MTTTEPPKNLGDLEDEVRTATDRTDPEDLEPLHEVVQAAVIDPWRVLPADTSWMPSAAEAYRTTNCVPEQYDAMRVKLGLGD